MNGPVNAQIRGRTTRMIRAWVTGRHRIWFTVIPGAVALILLLMALVPFLLDANTFRPVIEKQISASINRPVRLGNLSFSLFTTSLVADNVVIGDDPQYGTAPFLQAKALHIGVEAWPLLSRRHLVLTRFTADEPQIHLVHSINGTWNFSTLSRTLLGPPQTGNKAIDRGGTSQLSASVPELTSAKIQVRGGTVVLEDLPAVGRPLVFQNVEFTARKVSAKGQFPFEASAGLQGGGSVTLDGMAGPLSAADISNTPFRVRLSGKSLNPVLIGLVEPSQGIGFSADVSAQAVSNGSNFRATGTVQASHLQLARNGVPAAQPVGATFDLAGSLAHAAAGGTQTLVQIRDLAVKTGATAAHVSGTVTLLPGHVTLNARLFAQRLPIDELQTLMPSVGVRLPRGASLRGGTVTANLSITGAPDAAEFSGPIEVEDTSLTGFDLGSKLSGLATLAGVVSGDSTAIRTLKTDVIVSPRGVDARSLYAELPTLGTASGEGTISPVGVLDFSLLVKLNGRAAGGGNLSGIVSSLGGLLGHTATSAIAEGIPVTITGTQQDPHIGVSMPLAGDAASAGHGGDRGLQRVRTGLLHGLLGGH